MEFPLLFLLPFLLTIVVVVVMCTSDVQQGVHELQSGASQPLRNSFLIFEMLPTTQQGPLQAFGSIQRTLRETDKRVTAVSSEMASITSAVDEKLQQLTRKTQQHDRKLREEMQELVSNLEELVMQMYDEHGRVLAEHREKIAALQSQLESEGAATRAALTSQQNQIDVLAAALRRQQELINEYVGASSTQMGAVQAGMAELQKVVGGQGHSIDELSRHVSAAEAELRAGLEERLSGCQVRIDERSQAIEGRLGEQQRLAEVALSQWSALEKKEGEASMWRAAADRAITSLAERADETAAAWVVAQTSQSDARAEMLARFEAEARGLELELERSLGQVREEMSLTAARKANTVDVEDRHTACEQRLAALSEELQPIVYELGEVHTAVQQVNLRVESREAREAKQQQKQHESARCVEKLHTEINEVRAISRTNQHGLASLMTSQQEIEALVRRLEGSIARVRLASDTQARYLSTVSDGLVAQKVVPGKFRSRAVGLPSFSVGGSEAFASHSPTSRAARGSLAPGEADRGGMGAWEADVSGGAGFGW